MYVQVKSSTCPLQGAILHIPELPYSQMQQEPFKFPPKNLEFPPTSSPVTGHFNHAAVSTSAPRPELTTIRRYLEDPTFTVPNTFPSQDWLDVQDFLHSAMSTSSAPKSSAANGFNSTGLSSSTLPRLGVSDIQEFFVGSTSASAANGSTTSQRPEFSNNQKYRIDSTSALISSATSPARKSKKRKLRSDKAGPNIAPLNKNAVPILNHWYQDHHRNPFPSDKEKGRLAADGSITAQQVTTWFGNHTTKSKKGKREPEEKLLDFCEEMLKLEQSQLI